MHFVFLTKYLIVLLEFGQIMKLGLQLSFSLNSYPTLQFEHYPVIGMYVWQF